MASVARILSSVLGEVRRVIEKDMELKGRLHGGLTSIKDEMESVATLIKQDEAFDGPVQEMRIRRFQEAAYDVEDFVEGLWEPGKYGLALLAVGADPRPPQLNEIDHLKERLKGLKDLNPSAQPSQDSDLDHGDASSVDTDCEVIDGPKKKIEELLQNPTAELRVIFIVGCRGVGKTALARAVYHNGHVRDQFEYVAWFEASRCNDKKALLSKAPENDGKQPGGTSMPANLEGIAADSRRYLVFVDGVQQAHDWEDTENDLLKYQREPKNVRGSRIIVTTSVCSVSSARGSRHVYRMQCLDEKESKTIFWRKVYGSDNMRTPPSLDTASGGIFTKCDGLPLALTSVAKHLSVNGEALESKHFNEVEEDLGKFLSSDSNEGRVFRKMRRALVQCYESLPDYDNRYCLLYLSIFPMGHRIKSKSLVRRLMAEGLVEAAEDGYKYLNKLTDKCIIDPVQFFGDSSDAKRFKVYGVVLEYIIEKSRSRNIVTLITEKGARKVNSTGARVRRVSLQSSTHGKCDPEFEEKIRQSVRSLTIFNGDFDFGACKKLRLLDLEGCTELRNENFQDICGLPLLRYLSLRKTGVNEIPKKIKKLQRLETLDIRETSVIELPIEAIRLPKLAYLFGKFKLPKVSKKMKSSFETFLSMKSNLHTISGFVVEKKQGPELAVLLARELKKIKVWCHETAADATTSVPDHEQASTSAVDFNHPPAEQKHCYWGSNNKRVESQVQKRPHTEVREVDQMLKKIKLESHETAADAPMSVSDHDHVSRSAATFDHPPVKPKWYSWGSKNKAGSQNHKSRQMRVDEEGRSDNFIRLLKSRFTYLESVSIVSTGLCKEFLGSLGGPGTISSIKLWGKLDSLPYDMLNELRFLTKLQLFSTGLSSTDLSALQNLHRLEYLKLEENSDEFINGIFTVNIQGFGSLKRLCIKAPKFPELQFEEGAMVSLISLHLLCPNSSHIKMAAMTIKGIHYLGSLSEVVLLSSASEEAMRAWENVANMHPKRPSLKKAPEHEDNPAV